MKAALLLLVAIAAAGCFPVPPADARTFIQDGQLCWESVETNPQLGTAIQCEVLP